MSLSSTAQKFGSYNGGPTQPANFSGVRFVWAMEVLGTLARAARPPMEEVARIAPVEGEPGLIAYECPSCRYATSVLSSKDGEAGLGPL